ncbi:MAG TPA: DUF2207 domain-containing protein [Rudaea sp.]
MKRIVFALAAWAVCAMAHADERILDYRSDIRVSADAAMQVSETIRVRAEGDRIRHGIYRDFPTDYRDRYGNRVVVEFEPLSAQRDGAPEPWRSERLGNGVRVYLGDAASQIAAGEHEYVITYRTTRQLGFFADHDELYWNATGNGWIFPIDHASAAVTLPGAVPPEKIGVTAYTGAQGARGNAFTAAADAPSHAVVQTTANLKSQEGLTIVVSFPKGLVAAPTKAQTTRWLLQDNRAIIVGSVGFVLVALYLIASWWKVGRDPRGGPVMPQYEAPDGYTPGELRFVEQMSYDDRCFAADLVDLAVHGAVEIHQEKSKYTLKGRDFQRVGTPAVELQLWDDLLRGRDELTMEQAQHEIIGDARDTHRRTIEKTRGAPNFSLNYGRVSLGGLGALATIYLVDAMSGALLRDQNGDPAPFWVFAIFSIFPLVFGGFAMGLLLRRGARWFRARGVVSVVKLVFKDLLFAILIVGCLAAYSMIGVPAGLFGAALAVALLLLVALFAHLMPAPTAAGRRLLDRIAGLRLYLGVAERDDLARQQAPPMTAQEFQRFLPFALALDVEKTWTDRFAAAVGPAAAAAAAASMAWYQSSSGSSLSSFTSGIGDSLSSTIASSSSAPGSSSGGGGGGSSGGGGGGGGGGGW